jgi:hypothetical protein
MLADQGASLLQSSVVAAVVAGAVSLTALVSTSRRDRLDRQRKLFAEAFEACIAYREYAYVVRRRDVAQPSSERARISTELSQVQMRLQSYCALLRVEAPRVGEAYGELISETKRIAGRAISAGWDAPAPVSDDDVRVRDVDLSELDAWDDRYLVEVVHHLALWPAWSRWRRGRVRDGVRPKSR